jgi:hypothetical protein
MFGVMTSVATARPAATVRPGAAARVATAAARPGAPLRARLAVPRAQVLVHASARLPAVAAARSRSPLGFAVRLASPVRRGRRGGSLVAGGAETSSSAETSAAETAGDDVDALAERLDKLKEKSQAMLAEAEALEKTATATGTDETSATSETSKRTNGVAARADDVSAKTPEPPARVDATAKKAAEPQRDDVAAADSAEGGASVVESVRVLAGVVAGASVLAVGGSYAAGATSLLATEPVLALFGSAAAFAAVSVIDAVTPALKKREAAAEAAAAAAKAANPPPRKAAAKKKSDTPAEGKEGAKAGKKSAMPAPVNKPVDASAAKKAALEVKAEDMAEGVGSVIKKKETPSSPADVTMRAATPDPVKADTQWLDPRDAARMSGAALTGSAAADGIAESLVKNDTASRVSSPFTSRAFSPLGAGGASVSGSADEVKLEELRAIATQRMAKQRMYEEYVKARPAAAGGGARMSVFGENENETAKKTSDAAASSPSGSPLARFLKLVFFPLLLPFAIVKFALRLIRNLLGGGKAAGAQ